MFILFQGRPKGLKNINSKGITQVKKAKTVPNPAANETPQAMSKFNGDEKRLKMIQKCNLQIHPYLILKTIK